MNSILEKEKKLNLALTRLKNLKLENPSIKKNIEILGEQKNQLEIEKSEIEKKYKTLVDEHYNLTRKWNFDAPKFTKQNQITPRGTHLEL